MTAAQDEAVVEECPPVGSGVMRGYLRADAPGGRFWFVLSNERLSYFESESSEEPLGAVHVDDVRSVEGAQPNSLPIPARTHVARPLMPRATVLSSPCAPQHESAARRSTSCELTRWTARSSAR